MLRLVEATARASGGVGRRAAAQLCQPRQSRLQAAPLDVQAAAVDAQQQERHELVVSESDFNLNKSKLRLDAFLAARLPAASRARLQMSIKGGLVAVNGRPQGKASHGVRPGDVVSCAVLPPPPLEASPEPLPLDIVYEDEHLIVINKAADMVMHPSPGHYSGTLVNALLHHCSLPAMRLGDAAAPLSLEGAAALAAAASNSAEAGFGDPRAAGSVAGTPLDLPFSGGAVSSPVPPAHGGASQEDVGEAEQSELEEEEDDDAPPFQLAAGGSGGGTVRPGIVHRLDKGTTGLVVVAKSDLAHSSLARQFKDRSVRRTYVAVTLGVPQPPSGRVATNIGRDLRDRKKMAAFAYACARGRTAASHYALQEVLAGGGAAVVHWRLETGRTHQIRVHAKHIGHPLFGDETYSSLAAAASIVGAGRPPRAAAAQAAARALGRPALHAKTLGFVHPASGELLEFDSELPADLAAAAAALRGPPFT